MWFVSYHFSGVRVRNPRAHPEDPPEGPPEDHPVQEGPPGPRPKHGTAQARFWKSGDLEIWKFGIQQMKKSKFSKYKFILPKMSARSGLVGNLPAPFGAIPGILFH